MDRRSFLRITAGLAGIAPGAAATAASTLKPSASGRTDSDYERMALLLSADDVECIAVEIVPPPKSGIALDLIEFDSYPENFRRVFIAAQRFISSARWSCARVKEFSYEIASEVGYRTLVSQAADRPVGVMASWNSGPMFFFDELVSVKIYASLEAETLVVAATRQIPYGRDTG